MNKLSLSISLMLLSTSIMLADSEKAPRIRLFGQNAMGVTLYKNSECINGITVSGGISQSFSSMLGGVESESLGIPETKTTKNISQRNGILSKAYYKEYELEANKPVIIRMIFSDVSGWHCKKPFYLSFTPKLNKDYEGHLDLHDGICEAVINEVASDGTLSKAEANITDECK